MLLPNAGCARANIRARRPRRGINTLRGSTAGDFPLLAPHRVLKIRLGAEGHAIAERRMRDG